MNNNISNTVYNFLKQGQNKINDPIKKIIQSSLAATCTIYVKSGRDQWIGSGFHLGDGHIATASHVVPPDLGQRSYEIILSFQNKTFYPATISITEPKFDAALLLAPDIVNKIPSVILADSNKAEIGDLIATISSPEGFGFTATVGRISNIHQGLGQNAPTPAWNDIIFIDADILEGSSGGMVIGTDGLVYGSIMGITGERAEIGLGHRSICPSNKIQILLDKVTKI